MIEIGKVKNNFTLDMTQYRKDHNLSYDLKKRMQKHAHFRGIPLW